MMNDKNTISMLLPSFVESGPAIVAFNIAKEIRKQNYRTIFISLRNNSQETKNWLKKENFELLEVGMKKIPSFRDIKKLEKIINELKINVIHSHGFWPIVLISKINAKNIKIATIHEETKKSLTLTYGKFISSFMIKKEKRALDNFDKIIACNYNVEESIYKDLNDFSDDFKKKVTTIQNGIEDIFPNKNLEINRDKNLKLITYANLIPLKNIEIAIKAVKIVVDENIPVIYNIFGDGPLEEKLKKFVLNEHLSSVIFFHGRKAREEIFKEIEKSDVVFTPSLSEGLSLSALEAMMMGKPLLSSNIQSFREIVTNGYNGFMCSPNDVDCFAKKIIELASNRNLLELISNNARKIYEIKFNSKIMADNYIKIYDSYLSSYDDA